MITQLYANDLVDVNLEEGLLRLELASVRALGVAYGFSTMT